MAQTDVRRPRSTGGSTAASVSSVSGVGDESSPGGDTRSGTGAADGRELLTVNMGPQHPSTHRVLRLELTLDGEVIVHCRPVIGYLHTGIEKTFEAKTYVQGVVLTDRM